MDQQNSSAKRKMVGRDDPARLMYDSREKAEAVRPEGDKWATYAVEAPDGSVLYTNGRWDGMALWNLAVHLGYRIKTERSVPLAQLVQTLSDEDLARLGLQRAPAVKLADETVPAPVEGEDILPVSEEPAPKKGRKK